MEIFTPIDRVEAVTSHRSSRFSKPSDVPLWYVLPLAPLMVICVLAFGGYGMLVVPAYFVAIEYIRRSRPDTITLFCDRLEVEGMYPVMLDLAKIDRIVGGKSGFQIFQIGDPWYVDMYSFRLLNWKSSTFFPNLYATANRVNAEGLANIKFELNSPEDTKFS